MGDISNRADKFIRQVFKTQQKNMGLNREIPPDVKERLHALKEAREKAIKRRRGL